MPPGRRVDVTVVRDVTLRARGLVSPVPFRDNGKRVAGRNKRKSSDSRVDRATKTRYQNMAVEGSFLIRLRGRISDLEGSRREET